MKEIIYGVVGIFVTFSIIIAIITVVGKDVQMNDLSVTLESAVDQAIDEVLANNTYSIDDNLEFQADLILNICNTIEGESDLDVEIMAVDYEKGLLSVNVKQTILNPNGKKSTKECSRTILLETVPNEENISTFSVKFYEVIRKDNGKTSQRLYANYDLEQRDSNTAKIKLPNEGTWVDASGNAVTPDANGFVVISGNTEFFWYH